MENLPEKQETTISQPLDKAIVEEMFAFRKQENDIRNKKLDNESKQIDNEKEVAMLAIRTEAAADHDSRESLLKIIKTIGIIALMALLLFFGFIILSSYLGFSGVALEIVKIAGSLIVGGFGGGGFGYYLGYKKKDPE